MGVEFPTQMRAAPSLTKSALSTFNLYNSVATSGNPTAISINDASSTGASIGVTTTAGSPTIAAGQGSFLYANGSTSQVVFNAEL
jgi:hypothetical protein